MRWQIVGFGFGALCLTFKFRFRVCIVSFGVTVGLLDNCLIIYAVRLLDKLLTIRFDIITRRVTIEGVVSYKTSRNKILRYLTFFHPEKLTVTFEQPRREVPATPT